MLCIIKTIVSQWLLSIFCLANLGGFEMLENSDSLTKVNLCENGQISCLKSQKNGRIFNK